MDPRTIAGYSRIIYGVLKRQSSSRRAATISDLARIEIFLRPWGQSWNPDDQIVDITDYGIHAFQVWNLNQISQ